jgi:integration host factor subunit beta
MTKSDLIERLCQDQKLPKGKAELLVNTIFECLEESLRRGERIEIRGFGSFEIRAYKSYQGRNPKTGVPVSVKEKRLPFFKVGKELKERVNGVPEGAPPGPASGGNGGTSGIGGGGPGHGQPRATLASSTDGHEAAPAAGSALARE